MRTIDLPLQFVRAIVATATLVGLWLTITAPVMGCAAVDTDLGARAKAHLDPMKPVYEQGVATFPGATDADRAIWREHMTQLDRLLGAGGAK